MTASGHSRRAPTVAVTLGIGVEVIVLAFAVVVIGGLGSLGGAALGALLVGLVRSATVRYWPEAELFSIYAVMAIVLTARPKGLFAVQEARKI
jgi:branched-chain amino acid transport system permease protein